jgi:outer membrane protein
MPRIPAFAGAAPLALLLCGGAALAQAPAPPAMTLPEALAHARAHQPDLRRALAEVEARLAEARVPRSAWFPRLGATVQLFAATNNNTTASYLNVREVDLPRIGGTRTDPGTDLTPHASTLAAVTIDQEVFDFGRIAAAAAVGDALAAVARATADTVGLEVQLAVEEAFHGVLAAKEVQKATDEAFRRAVAHRDFAQAGARSGLRPPIELTRAQADVAQLEVRRARAAAGLSIARAALAASIGGEALEVDAKEAPPEEAAAPAFDEAVRLATQRNPAVAAAIGRLQAQRAVTRSILREMTPNLFASASLSGRAGGATPTAGSPPPGDGLVPDVANWHAGLVLQWNVFDATVLARRAASQAREEVAQADLDAVRTGAVLLAQRSYLDLDAAQRALPGLEAAVQAAQANHAQAEARFRAGLGTTVELADAEALRTSAEFELAIGRFAVARARAQLGRAIGESSKVAKP